MQVIIQPRDGIGPLLEGIRDAQDIIEITIYRIDRLEIEEALVEAVSRGVAVHALITYTNREELKEIKKLERRLADRGVKVTRTPEDLVRYHTKMMIIDRRHLYLLTFNYTFLDIHHSRSFGIRTQEPELVKEAIAIFESDQLGTRNHDPFEHFVISPLNARRKLSDFILGAQKQLLIYDGKLTDAEMIRHLADRAKAGVEIKVIGEMNKRIKGIEVHRMPLIHLHVQAIIRDGKEVFFGSQSLHKVELDERREVGLITSNQDAVKNFQIIFELDWGDIINDAQNT